MQHVSARVPGGYGEQNEADDKNDDEPGGGVGGFFGVFLDGSLSYVALGVEQDVHQKDDDRDDYHERLRLTNGRDTCFDQVPCRLSFFAVLFMSPSSSLGCRSTLLS